MANKRFRRKILFIKKGLQFRYMFSVIMIMLISSLFVGWTIYYTIWKEVASPANIQYNELEAIWEQINYLLLIRVPALALIVGVSSLMLSHKIAGPVYRFEQSAKQIANGDLSLRIVLRKGDELVELADVFNKMTANLENIVKKDREVIERIIGIIDKIPVSIKQEEISDEEKEKIIYELTDVVSELKEITYAFRLRETEKENKKAEVEDEKENEKEKKS
ncbi:MAG: HAMP domain-containing protein [Candidatus Muiribacteriota bacterium]